jgi:hypothetical protein
VNSLLGDYVKKGENIKLQGKRGYLDNYFNRCNSGDNARDLGVQCGTGHGLGNGGETVWRIQT